jgi:hypothetical protein
VRVKSKDRKGRRATRGTGLGSHNNGPRFICTFSLSRSSNHCIPKKETAVHQFSHMYQSTFSSIPVLPRIHQKMTPANMLSDDSDSDEDLNEITINEHYAKAYAYRKERQELERREHQ